VPGRRDVEQLDVLFDGPPANPGLKLLNSEKTNPPPQLPAPPPHQASLTKFSQPDGEELCAAPCPGNLAGFPLYLWHHRRSHGRNDHPRQLMGEYRDVGDGRRWSKRFCVGVLLVATCLLRYNFVCPGGWRSVVFLEKAEQYLECCATLERKSPRFRGPQSLRPEPRSAFKEIAARAT